MKSILARGLAIAALLLLTVYVLRRLDAPAEPEEPPPRSDLRAWELLGCYELDAGPWGGADESGSAGGSSDESGPAPSLPDRVMLAADSVDEWGRQLTSYRAVSLDPDRDPSATLRWFVRADTLWIVWSRSGIRGGVALFSEADSLTGRARAFRRSDSLDASARVRAWRINCATLDRDARRRRSRR